MKVLLVTSQLIEDKNSAYYCSGNFYDILQRFSRLGELFLCAGKYNGHNSHLKIDKCLNGIIKYGNVDYLLHKDYLHMSVENRRIIENKVKDVDLVISYGSSYDLYKIAKRYDKKFMSFVVSCAWDAFWNHGWQGKMLALYKFLRSRYTIRHSDYVLYVSNEFLQKRYPTDAKYQAGCSNVKIPALDDKILEERLNFLEQWDGKELHVATTAAVDVVYKGQQYVMRAMYELKKKGICNIHYHLFGGGNNNRLASLARQYGIEEQVHFHGSVPHDEIFSLLDTMHLYIQPSLQEGLPRSMVEAMSRGLLCIGANTAAIPELIQPRYVTHRKSYSDIASLLENVTKEEMIEQGKINFAEAKKYQDSVINERRNAFFDKVKNDILK